MSDSALGLTPVWRDADVLVVGASSRAVEAALALHRKGRRVLAVSDLSYFGEETAGTLSCLPLDPAAVKRSLEEALLRAGVPFLYLVRPVSLLRDEGGGVAGVLLAARSSLLAVTCRAIVDATRHGGVAVLAGARRVLRRDLPARVGWTVLSNGPPPGWEGHARERLPPLRRGETTYGVWRLEMERTSDPLAREHLARAALQASNLLLTADLLEEGPEFESSPLPGVFLPDDLEGAAAAGARRPKPVVPTRGDFRFAPTFLRSSVGSIEACPENLPLLGKFDVVVAGGGTAGAPAGIAAAREGAKTLVLEVQHGLGGVGTLGLVSCYWFGNKVGFTAELDEAVMRLDPDSRNKKGGQWSPAAKSAVYHHLLRDAGGMAWLGSYAFGVRMEGDRVNGLLVSTPLGAGLVEAGCVVDATGNADVAAAAGAPCRVIGAGHVATQGSGLSPRVHPGVRHQNSDHTFVDETDPEGITHAFVYARAKYPNDFDTSPLVDTRERRQILAELDVSPLDILAGRTFPDTVFTARSNFDTHGFIVHPVFMVAVPDHQPLNAHVPFRCMLPRGVEGVLVTGLGMGAHRDALPVIRMQADVQNQGFAAGLAAATSAKERRRLRDLDLRALQRRLVALGSLAPEVPTQGDSFPVSPRAIEEAARGNLATPMNAALLFAHPELARPLLLAVLRDDPSRRLDAALILGLMGCAEAGPVLAGEVTSQGWDEGWNYRGMGQFGASMSRLDAMILALARTGDPSGAGVIEEKVRQLDEKAAFSHCRVVGIAAALLRDRRLAAALARLLKRPGMQGHAEVDSLAVRLKANGDPCETEARNLSLRELYLARGLYLAGDADGLGRTILEIYARDLRGHYARHARAVLASEPFEEMS